MLTIRSERPEDHDAARRINEAAFGTGSGEAGLVDALRTEDAHVPELCLVAVEDEEPVGHLFFSKATLASGHAVLALAPMAARRRPRPPGVLPALRLRAGRVPRSARAVGRAAGGLDGPPPARVRARGSGPRDL